MAQQGMTGQGAQMQDKDILQLALNECKNAASAVNQYILEANDDSLRRDYMTALGDLYSQQKQVYDVMEQNGWYSVKNASPQDISQAKNKFSQQQNQQQGQQQNQQQGQQQNMQQGQQQNMQQDQQQGMQS